jgi:adenylate cyclase, class 2
MEIEAKVRIKDVEAIKLELRKLGAIFSHVEIQEDHYFKKEGAISQEGAFPLRLRKTPISSELAFKDLTDVDGAWIEHETRVDDHESTSKIITSIGYVKGFEIHKEREHGKIGDINICLDTIRDLGTFLELEVISDDVAASKKKIISLLTKLGFSEEKIIHRGYMTLLYPDVFKG